MSKSSTTTLAMKDKKPPKTGGFYTPFLVRGKVRALFFAGVSKEAIAKECGIHVTTVTKILDAPETQEISQKLISGAQRKVAASLLVEKAVVAMAKVLDKEIANGKATEAREILDRYAVIPELRRTPENTSPEFHINLNQNSMAVSTSEGQKKMVERMVAHVGELEAQLATPSTSEVPTDG